jgi:hypothetical protein
VRIVTPKCAIGGQHQEEGQFNIGFADCGGNNEISGYAMVIQTLKNESL